MEKKIYPENKLLKASIYTSLLCTTILVLGFRHFFVGLLLAGSIMTGMILYLRRRLFYFSYNGNGLTSRYYFKKAFISWGNIRRVEYTSFNHLGFNAMGNPKLVITSYGSEPSIEMFIELFERQEIIKLLNKIIAEADKLEMDEKLKKTLQYGLLPNDNIL